MRIVSILLICLFIFGCNTTEEAREINQNDAADLREEREFLEQLIEVSDPVTGKTRMQPMSDFFELIEVETPPKVLVMGEAKMPKGFKGKISAIVSLYVSLDGRAKDVKIVSNDRPEFDDFVIEAASSTLFKPAEHRGKLVEVKIRMPIEIEF